MTHQYLIALRLGRVRPWRSGRYLDWVVTQPCCACYAPADDPHHILDFKGTGTKAPDYMTIPLCRPHHNDIHADKTAWEAKHGTQIEHVYATLFQAIDQGVLVLADK